MYIRLLEAAGDDAYNNVMLDASAMEAKMLYILLPEEQKRIVDEMYNGNVLKNYTIDVANSVLDVAAASPECMSLLREVLSR